MLITNCNTLKHVSSGLFLQLGSCLYTVGLPIVLNVCYRIVVSKVIPVSWEHSDIATVKSGRNISNQKVKQFVKKPTV